MARERESERTGMWEAKQPPEQRIDYHERLSPAPNGVCHYLHLAECIVSAAGNAHKRTLELRYKKQADKQ